MAVKNKNHTSVQQFKEFVKRHPKLIIEVRQGKTTWQQLYEQWYLLGEDDTTWDNYHSTKSKQTNNKSEQSDTADKTTTDFLNTIMDYVKKLDMEQVQHYIGQVNNALDEFQKLLAEMENNNTEKENPEITRTPRNLFSFRK